MISISKERVISLIIILLLSSVIFSYINNNNKEIEKFGNNEGYNKYEKYIKHEEILPSSCKVSPKQVIDDPLHYPSFHFVDTEIIMNPQLYNSEYTNVYFRQILDKYVEKVDEDLIDEDHYNKKSYSTKYVIKKYYNFLKSFSRKLNTNIHLINLKAKSTFYVVKNRLKRLYVHKKNNNKLLMDIEMILYRKGMSHAKVIHCQVYINGFFSKIVDLSVLGVAFQDSFEFLPDKDYYRENVRIFSNDRTPYNTARGYYRDDSDETITLKEYNSHSKFEDVKFGTGFKIDEPKYSKWELRRLLNKRRNDLKQERQITV